ncbi:Glutamate--tRNA ligase mitochondrial [Rhodotorula sphaerocarpa]
MLPADAVKPPKLRFAPSPTGYLHLGGLRTALYNHLLARKLGGKWVLRIEDTDRTRYVEGAVEALLRTLRWAKLDYDEGPEKGGPNEPYFQSERKEVYDRYLEPLIQSGRAYHCFCTPERLAETRKRLQREGSHEGYDRRCLGLPQEEVQERLQRGERNIVRFKSSSGALTQGDMIYDSIHYDSLALEDFVLRKSDGLPTYHFANVVDDYEMGITHVLRGEEWLPSTPKHLQLYNALGLPRPKFAHLPLLVNPDGSKLSKRAGDVRVDDYITRGYEPEALLNFVALMGWSPQSSGSDTPSPAAADSAPPSDVANEEVLPLPALIEAFSLEGVNKNRATMQSAKLDFLNRAHLRIKLADTSAEGGRRDVAKRARAVVMDKWPELAERRPRTVEETYIARVADALKDRMHTILDIPSLGPYFFHPPDLDSAISLRLYGSVPSATYRESLSAALESLSALPDSAFSEPSEPSETPSTDAGVRAALDALVLARPGGKKAAKEVMTPLRHALTGQKVGASVPDVVCVLGKEEALQRLRDALAWFEAQEA